MICSKCGKETHEHWKFCNFCGTLKESPETPPRPAVKFSFLCQFKFTELPGDDKVARDCQVCRQRVVNLDLFTPAEQQEFLELSPWLGNVCVSANTEHSESTTVVTWVDEAAQTDPDNQLKSLHCPRRPPNVLMGSVGVPKFMEAVPGQARYIKALYSEQRMKELISEVQARENRIEVEPAPEN